MFRTLVKTAIFALTLCALMRIATECQAQGAAPGGTDPEQLRRRAEDILAKKKYQKERVIEEPVHEHRVQTASGPSPSPPPGSSVILEIIVWSVLATVAGLLLYAIIRGIIARRRREKEPRPAAELGKVATLDVSNLESVVAVADKFAADGSYTDAIRHMFRDAARRIEGARRIPLTRSQTNHEYLAAIPEDFAFKPVVGTLAEAIEKFYYGGRLCTKEDYARCRGAWQEFTAAVGGAK
jgi:hypothetical protein